MNDTFSTNGAPSHRLSITPAPPPPDRPIPGGPDPFDLSRLRVPPDDPDALGLRG